MRIYIVSTLLHNYMNKELYTIRSKYSIVIGHWNQDDSKIDMLFGVTYWHNMTITGMR